MPVTKRNTENTRTGVKQRRKGGVPRKIYTRKRSREERLKKENLLKNAVLGFLSTFFDESKGLTHKKRNKKTHRGSLLCTENKKSKLRTGREHTHTKGYDGEDMKQMIEQ